MSCYGLIYVRLYTTTPGLLEVDVCLTVARTRVNIISMELDLLQVFFSYAQTVTSSPQQVCFRPFRHLNK